ncbi:MAG TPA: hypothetical protein VMB85_09215 [Bryobacteraceae bacterium]|jgi:hypothetical protein|nr:hypothetical protein [Bryobacteraceae bacterium]
MSKQEEAGLILKLYELRREEVMRKARDWYFREFHPQSVDDFNTAIFGPHSGHVRMAITYWEMAAALVHHGAIPLDMFLDTNGEYLSVFAKIEPMLTEIRQSYGPNFARNLEKLVDLTPDGRKQTAEMRERMKVIAQQLSQPRSRL